MSKVTSNNICVYPAVARNTDSKYITELSLTSIFKHITDRDSFVINYSNNTIEFMLKGYYFKLNLDGILTETSEGLWVKLCMKENVQELCGDTLGGEYGGLEYVINTPAEDLIYFNLLEKVESGFQVPMKSKIKFNNTSVEGVNYLQIECGSLKEVTSE